MEDKYSVLGTENGFERVVIEGITFEEAMHVAEKARAYYDTVSISQDYTMRSPSQNMLIFSDCEMMILELKKLLDDRPEELNEQLVFLGNFINGRKGFLEFMKYIKKLREEGRDLVLVRGRNEHNLLEAIHGKNNFIGEPSEVSTLISGIEKQLNIKLTDFEYIYPYYYNMLKDTYTYFEDDQHIFVSGGLDLSGRWRESLEVDLYNTSDKFIEAKNNTGKTIVFGNKDVNYLNRTRFRKPWISEEQSKIGINGNVKNYGRLIGLSIIEGDRSYIGIRHRKTRVRTYAYDVFDI